MAFPSLNAIRAFEAAARLLSFKDAAEELKLSASAVSRHIRSLERSLGVELFERGFRHVQLTEKALPYARRLSEAFRIIQDSTELVSRGASSAAEAAKSVAFRQLVFYEFLARRSAAPLSQPLSRMRARDLDPR